MDVESGELTEEEVIDAWTGESGIEQEAQLSQRDRATNSFS